MDAGSYKFYFCGSALISPDGRRNMAAALQ